MSRASCFRSGTFERADACLSDVYTTLFRSIADADGAHAHAIHLQREATAQRYLPTLAAHGEAEGEQNVDFVSRASGSGRQPANGSAVRFANGDFHGRKFCAVHACKCEQVAAVVNNGDVHGYFDLGGARLRSRENGLCAFQRQFGIIASYRGHDWFLLSLLPHAWIQNVWWPAAFEKGDGVVGGHRGHAGACFER